MAIAKTTVTHALIDPSADPIQRGGTISLGGFVGREWRDIQGMTVDGQVITWVAVDTDGSGVWSVELIPNAQVAFPENTLYRYLPAQGEPVVFAVPDDAGSHELMDLVVVDPASWPVLQPTVTGPQGESLEFDWDGTQLGVRVGSSGDYQYVDLKGATGDKGNTGDTGKSIEFNWDGTQLGVRVEGDPSYQYVDLKGATGDKGDTGAKGDKGDTGITWQGAWSSATGYAVGDAVTDGGSSFYCTSAVGPSATHPASDTAHWTALALKGVDGTGSVSSVNGVGPDGGGDVTLAASNVDAVPTTRTVNGKALSADITLDAAGVGARADDWVPAWDDVQSKPATFPPVVGTDATDAMAGNKVANDLNGVRFEPGDDLPVRAIRALTQDEYDSLASTDPNTLYVTVPNDESSS